MQIYFIRHGESTNNALYSKNKSSEQRTEDPELTSIGRKQALHLAIYLSNPENFEPSAITRRFAALQKNGNTENTYLADQGGLTHLYTSLMVRAVSTGSIISESTGLSLVGWTDIHEGGGIYLDQDVDSGTLTNRSFSPSGLSRKNTSRVGMPGKSRSYFEKNYPQLLLPTNIGEKGWWNRPYEARFERPSRAVRVLNEMIQRHGKPRSDGSEDRVGLISHGGFYNYFLRAVINFDINFDGDNISDVWFELNNTGVTRIDYLDGHFLIVYMNRTHFLPGDLVT
jgi:2,3-bisphosphoglycerate-dependent phosphoglycerate mutase